MAKKIHKLTETGRQKYFLIGISSYENDYRVCWDINNMLGTDLQRTDNFSLFNSKLKADQTFSVFFFEDENRYTSYKLVRNRGSEGILIEEWKKIDFLLKITGEISRTELESIYTRLKSSQLIQTAAILETEKQRSLQILESLQ